MAVDPMSPMAAGGPQFDFLSSMSGRGANLAAAGGVVQGLGALMGAVGAYYAAETQKHLLKSQAMAAEFEASMSRINASRAERMADEEMQAGALQIAQSGMAYEQAKASYRTGTAARGIKAGVGSAAEGAASIEYAKKLDAHTIDMNRIRAAEAARASAVNFRNNALLAKVSAGNLRYSAQSVSPMLGATSSLLSSAGSMARYYAGVKERE